MRTKPSQQDPVIAAAKHNLLMRDVDIDRAAKIAQTKLLESTEKLVLQTKRLVKVTCWLAVATIVSAIILVVFS